MYTIRPQHILLIEADPDAAQAHAKLLERNNLRCSSLSSAHGALEMLAAEDDIDLLLFDLDLMEPDGAALVHKINEFRTIPLIPISAASSATSFEDVDELSRYGSIHKNATEPTVMQTILLGYRLFDAERRLETEREKHRRTESELQQQSDFIEAVLDHLPIGLAVNYMSDGTATYMNTKFEEIYGWSKEVMRDYRTFFDAVYPDHEYREKIRKRISEDIGSGDAERMQWENVAIRRNDGSRAFVSAQNIPLPHQDLMISTVMDVTDKFIYEESLKESEARYKALADHLPNGMIALFDYDLYFITAHGEELSGGEIGPDFFVGKRLRDIYPKEIADRDEPALAAALKGEKQEHIVSHAGRTHRVVTSPVYDKSEKIVCGMVMTQDITESIQNQKRLQELLEEQKVLFRETNHRIKNNLMMVNSLVSLAAQNLSVDLDEVTRQIETIKTVHELLVDPSRLSEFEITPFVERIIDSLIGHPPPNWLELTVELDPLSLHSDLAVPVGLIVNELVSNVIRHGFRSERNERLVIRLRRQEQLCVIEVANTGRIFPEEVDIENPRSLGLQLIRALTDQIEGRLELERSSVTRFTLEFPIR